MLPIVRLPVGPAVAALIAAAALAGCGGPSDEQQVARTVAAFGRASAAHEYGTICRSILAPSLVADVTAIGLPCETALQRGLGRVRGARLVVGAITVNGDRASAQVRSSAANQAPSTDTLQLVKTHGGWRIASLGAR
jgi:hypothetical protein